MPSLKPGTMRTSTVNHDHYGNILHRILVAVDFSKTSNKAYGYARELARNIGAEIHVVHVLDTHYLTCALHIIIEHRDEMVERWKERCQEKLNMYYRKREENGFTVQLHMREGRPHEEILKAAEELGADLIVIGSHGWSGLERCIFGSIARKVLKISDIPVLIIKSGKNSPVRFVSPGTPTFPTNI